MRLKGGGWSVQYTLQVEDTRFQSLAEMRIAGTLTPPLGDQADSGAFEGVLGTADWRCRLPELGLDLRMDVDDEELESLPLLTDPQLARAFLEQSIRGGAPAYREARIRSCTPKVMRSKPGRCTVLYRVEYETEPPVGQCWPDPLIAKTYGGSKGRNAYDGMRKLWDSSLSSGEIVSIAEPIAYLPEHKVLVQGPVREDQTLKELIRAALRLGTTEAVDDLLQIVRLTARGLVALHQCGVRHGETVTWEDELAEIHEEIGALTAVFPWFEGAAAPLLDRLRTIAATSPAQPACSAHRSFRPMQVLVHEGKVGFIDFDGFCMAEPALDVALFRATTRDIGINTSPSSKQKEFEYPDEATRQARIAQVETICEAFLAEYERLAPISRERVALWESLDLLTYILRCWTKVKPHQIDNFARVLEAQIRTSGVLPA